MSEAKSLEAKDLIVERTYRATAEELWGLWTTKDGFESWWGPEGFHVEVHEIEPRLGGAIRYDMIASAPEVVAAMERLGQPLTHATHGTFSEVALHRRLALTHVIDFLPGVTSYQSTMVVELFPSGEFVRMVVTLSPMHNPEFTQMQLEGFTSQLRKLDKRFGPAA